MIIKEKTTLYRGRIARDAAIALLDDGEGATLTLLLAPAGSGKSTLLEDWIASHPDQRMPRLALDSRDNDPTRFFRRLLDALRQPMPEFDTSWFDPFLRAQHDDRNRLADTLCDALASVEGALFLILDDFQHIHAPSIVDVIAQLLDHPPPDLHLIIASRNQPPFSLTRLKLAGQLRLIDANALRLTLAEVHQLNALLGGVPLNEPAAQHILQMNEGWLTGIKIALLAARKSGPDALFSFSGTHADVVDYFGNVVYKALPVDVSELFLLSAIFDQVDGELCDAVLERSGSARVLEQIAHRELFLVPVEGQPGRYRYHALLLDFLRSRLRLERPERITRLHQRAAHFLLQRGDLQPALEHARQGEDPDRYLDMLQRCFHVWIQHGDFAEIARWSEQISDALIQRHPDIAAPLICGLILSRRFHHARYYLDGPSGARAADPRISGFLEQMLSLFQHDTESLDVSELEQLSRDSHERYVQAFALTMLAYHHLQHAQVGKALELASQGRVTLDKLGYTYLAAYAGLVTALCHRQNNALLSAIQAVQGAFARTPRDTPSWTLWATGQLVILYEQNDLDDARTLCADLLPRVTEASATEVIATVYLTLSRLHHLRGDGARARRLLDRLGRILQLGSYARFTSQVVQETLRQALQNPADVPINRLLEQHGLLAVISQWLPPSASRPRAYRESTERLTLAAVYGLRALGRTQDAVRILKALLAHLQHAGLKNRALVCEANLLVLTQQDKLPRQRQNAVHQFLSRHEYYHLTRSIFDEAPGLNHLLAEACASTAVVLPSAYLARFKDVIDLPKPTSPGIDPRTRLTAKELDILNCLLNGFDNNAISRKTGTRLSTTKWHLKNIYQKLDVSNRTEAVLKLSSTISIG